MRKARRDKEDDPWLDFPLTEIRRETPIGLCVEIRGTVVWVPRTHCKWTDDSISMPQSVARQNSLIVDLT